MERAAAIDSSAPPQRHGAAFYDDPDAALDLRGVSVRADIRTHADFLARQSELTHEQREEAAQRLRIGRPRKATSRFPTADELGIARDEATGRALIDPEDPTLADRDVDTAFYGKSPSKIVVELERRERGDDGSGNRVTAATLQREGMRVRSGSHSSGRRREAPKSAPSTALDRLRAEELADAIGSGGEVGRAARAIAAARADMDRSARGRPLKPGAVEASIVVSGRVEPSVVLDLHAFTGLSVVGFSEAMHGVALAYRAGESPEQIGARLDAIVSRNVESVSTDCAS